MWLMAPLLLGTSLAAIPLIVHMLRRQNTVPIEWGAMQFLLETPLKARRRRSIDNWLLMLVRMAILIFLALALARPLIKGNTFVSSTPMDVAVVIDHSLSMGRRGDATGAAGTLFDQAVNDAEHLAGILPPSASISIILAEHTPRVITSLPIAMDSSNKSPADNTRAANGKPPCNSSTKPSPASPMPTSRRPSKPPPKFSTAAAISASSSSSSPINNAPTGPSAAIPVGTPRSAELRDPESLPIYALAVTPPASIPNLSVGSIAVQPPFLGIHRPAQITATIANTGTTDLANIPIQLLIDGRVIATQQLPSLGPGKSNTVHFDEYFSEPGSHWVRIHADVIDGLEADNAATTAVTVSPRLPVLLIDGQLAAARRYPAAEFLLFAMQPMDPSVNPDTLIAPKVVSVADVDSLRFEDYPIIVLNDVPRLTAATVARLTAYAQSGHGLWIILGPRTRDTFLSGTLSKSPLFPATANRPTILPTPVTIDIKDPDNPTVAVVTAAQRNALAGATISAWWPLSSVSPDMHTILATTAGTSAGGDPLATEMPLGNNGGRVIVWTTSASDLTWNNLPVVPNFTPLVNETLLHLASSQAAAQSRDLDAGQTLLWSGPASLGIQSATITLPTGATHPVQPELRGDRYLLTTNDTHLPGLYELRFTPTTIPQPVYYTVNIDRAELDPATLTPTDFDWLKTNNFVRDNLTLSTLPKALNAQVGGAEFWWLLALLVLALLVVEAILTTRLVKQQTTVDPEMAGVLPSAPQTLGGIAR